MIYVVSVRYTGWPVSAPWVALCPKDDSPPVSDWYDHCESTLVECLNGGDQEASDATKFVQQNWNFAGGKTPQEAVAQLLLTGVPCESFIGGYEGN